MSQENERGRGVVTIFHSKSGYAVKPANPGRKKNLTENGRRGGTAVGEMLGIIDIHRKRIACDRCPHKTGTGPK